MKIKKEYVLIALIIIGIFVLELVTNYISKQSVVKISENANEVIESLEKAHDLKDQNIVDEAFIDKLDEKLKKLRENWNEEEDKLAMFAEHNELEKVTTAIVLLEEYTKNEQYDDALANGKEFLYRLKHIKEKDDLKLKNIF